MPKVFLSYSHDSDTHRARILAFADALRGNGIEAIIDQYETTPDIGWPLWTERNLDTADFVLLICTDVYHRRVMQKEKPGEGLGVQWEGKLIYNHIYGNPSQGSRYIPILLPGFDRNHIPTPVQGHSFYEIRDFILSDTGYEALYRHLTGQPAAPPLPIGPITALPPTLRGTGGNPP